MLKIPNDIRKMAKIVRSKAIKYATDNDPICCPDTLCGMCGICSVALATLMRKAGYRPRVVERGDHVWIEWRGRIIDLTATQFFITKKIFVGEKKEYFHYDYRFGNVRRSDYNWYGWGGKLYAQSPMNASKMLERY